ncbi:hypothetical protein [Acutalibacter sp.]|uniref:hypothetical protein n=1 Tax=Acutalibacter sp. TaxID=1918636 RepID=UPI00216CF9AA|nr:hypothetical protein [Acutalibacter sp.]
MKTTEKIGLLFIYAKESLSLFCGSNFELCSLLTMGHLYGTITSTIWSFFEKQTKKKALSGAEKFRYHQ